MAIDPVKEKLLQKYNPDRLLDGGSLSVPWLHTELSTGKDLQDVDRSLNS